MMASVHQFREWKLLAEISEHYYTSFKNVQRNNARYDRKNSIMITESLNVIAFFMID